jgi:hypothetical protein
MISAGLLPLVMRKRATVEPVMARFSDASRVNPRRPTAACTVGRMQGSAAACLNVESFTRTCGRRKARTRGLL